MSRRLPLLVLAAGWLVTLMGLQLRWADWRRAAAYTLLFSGATSWAWSLVRGLPWNHAEIVIGASLAAAGATLLGRR